MLIFVNHIHFLNWRVAICPLDTYETIYLDIDFSPETAFALFELTELDNPGLARVYGKLNCRPNDYKGRLKHGTLKKVTVFDF
jgi:hypothetical protein